MALTDAQVKAAKPQSKRHRISDEGGLLLEVDPAGGKYWLWRHRYPPTKNGKQQDYRIGPYPRIGLKQARLERDEQRLLLRQGINPCERKRLQKQEWLEELMPENSFKAVATTWHQLKAAGTWSTRHADDVMKKLSKDVFPAIGEVGVAQLSKQQCNGVLNRIQKRGSLEQAKRTLNVIAQVMDYAESMDLCQSNPARSVLKVAPVKQTVDHFGAINWSELPELRQTLLDNPKNCDAMTIHGLWLLLLCFPRTQELVGARWDEIDFEKSLWTVPAERMKGKRGNRKEHLIPLSQQAKDHFKALYAINGDEGTVFKSIRTKSGMLSNNTFNMALKRMGFDGRMTPHGFRAFAMTNIQEQLGIELRVVDRQLAHIEKSKVTAAYNRAEYIEERKSMMQRWADLVAPKKA